MSLEASRVVAFALALWAPSPGAVAGPSELSEKDEIMVAGFETLLALAVDERFPRPPVWCLILGTGRTEAEMVDPPSAVLEALAEKQHSVLGMRDCEGLAPETLMPRAAAAGLTRVPDPGDSAALSLDAWFDIPFFRAGGCTLSLKKVDGHWTAGGGSCAGSVLGPPDLGRARGSASSCDSVAPATPSEQRERDEIAVAAFAALIEAALQPPIEGCPPGQPAVWCLVSGPRPGDLAGVDPSAAVLDALAAKGHSVRGTQACADLPSTQLWPRAAAGIDCIPDPKGAARLRLDGWINVFERPRLGNCTIEMKKSGGHWAADAACSAISGIIGGLPCGPP